MYWLFFLDLHYFVQILHLNDETEFEPNKMFEVFHPSPADETLEENRTKHLQKNLRGDAADRIYRRKILLERLKNNYETDPDIV